MSTLGDFVWATWIPGHRQPGGRRLLSVGALLARVAGYAAMFVVWIAVWVGLGLLNERLARIMHRFPSRSGESAGLIRRATEVPASVL